jgi:guanine deaminase
MEHRELIARAIALSEEGMSRAEGGPFGALVARDGEVLAEGWNRVPASNDPTAHAEIVAIRAAAKSLGTFSLAGCVLYSSCEPCPMCLAASYWARVDHVYYANTRSDAAEIGFDDQFFYDELSLPGSERSLPLTRVMVDGAATPMRNWSDDPGNVRY